MTKKFIFINGLEQTVPARIFESEFKALYVSYVQRIGGNAGVGFMGKMGWDASHKNRFRSALDAAGIKIEKDPPEILAGFELGPDGRVLRINRDKFPF
jgi:hypothetical protein